MMTYDIPPDLIEEILSRVPAGSLSRLRSTCKRWNTLFKDQRFTKKHSNRAPKQFLNLMLNKYKVFSLSINLHGIDNNGDLPFIESKSEIVLKESHSSSGQVNVVNVFHCDGLLLCNTDIDRLLVWNPCTGETRCFRPSNHYYKYSMYALGYENNKYCRNYKLLRYRSNSDLNDPVVEFEIYEFSSSSWRFLEFTANFLIRTRGVSLKGNTYWLTCENCLLSFDFTTERLESTSLPFEFTCCCTIALSTVREEQLLLFHQTYSTQEVKIWMTTIDKTDQTIVLSWRIFLAIDKRKLSSSHTFTSCVSFFIDEEKKSVVCCDSARGLGAGDRYIQSMFSVIGEYGEIHFGESIFKAREGFIFNYVPSLVQMEQGSENKKEN